MQTLTEQQLRQIMPMARGRAAVFLPYLTAAMARRKINTVRRVAAFLAQVGHESGHLLYVRELASGAAYDTGKLAEQLGNTPAADGDGQRYKGRGLIQVTGRSNYRSCSLALFGDERLLERPELLEQPEWAAESAAWFWEMKGLNTLADAMDINRITRRINGGLNGLADRLALWGRAREVLA